MLSLMYAGEMCYWYWELCTTIQTTPKPDPANPDPNQTIPHPKFCSSPEPELKSETRQECYKVKTIESKQSGEGSQTESQRQSATVESKETYKSLPDSGIESCSSRDGFISHANKHSTVELPSLFCAMKHSQGDEFVKRWVSDFDPQKNARELFSKYIDVARGPLKAQGWNYDRAVQLLVKLRRATH